MIMTASQMTIEKMIKGKKSDWVEPALSGVEGKLLSFSFRTTSGLNFILCCKHRLVWISIRRAKGVGERGIARQEMPRSDFAFFVTRGREREGKGG